MSNNNGAAAVAEVGHVDELEQRLARLRSERANREAQAEKKRLERQIVEEVLDARAEAIAEQLEADGHGQRGIDFEVVKTNGRIYTLAIPKPANWEKFQACITRMITANEHVPAHEYRNLARSAVLRPEGDDYGDLGTREQLDADCARFPNLANKLYLILGELADGRTARRAGK